MPWLPDFGITFQTTTEGSAEKVTADMMGSYVGSVQSRLPAFAAEGIVVHDPRAGRVEGLEAFKEFLRSSFHWLEEKEARVDWIASTATPGRAVGELVAHLTTERARSRYRSQWWPNKVRVITRR